MSDSLFSRFIGGTISLGLGALSAMVLGLLGTMVATRHLSAEAFGAFVLLQVAASFLTQVSGFGLNASVTKFVTDTEGKPHRRRLINTALCFRLFTILIVSLVTLIARPALSTVFSSSLLPNLAVFVPLLFLLQSSSGLLKSVLQGFFLFERISITDFIASLSNFLLIVAFVLFLDRGVIGLIYARVISLSLSCAFAYFSTPIKKQLEFHFSILKEVLAFGFPLQINDIMTLVFSRIDTLIISVLLGPAGIAYYEIARKIPDSLVRLYEAFSSVYFPLMSRLFALGEQREAAKMLNHSTRWISFLSIFGALIALIFGNDVISLLFSEKYLPSVPVFALLMIGVNLALVEYTLGYSLVAIGDSDKPAIVNVVHTAVSLLANLLLIPISGLVGAALANVAGNLVGSPLDVLFLRRRRVDVKIGDYLKPILIFGAYWLLILFLKPNTLLEKISIIVLFILTCVFLSVITIEDLAAISREAKTTLFKALQRSRSWSAKV